MPVNDNFRKKEAAFSKESFKSPDSKYYPIYSWIWNAPVTDEETDRQLDEFVRLGIKGFYIIPEPKTFRPNTMPTMLEPDYLTEPYYQAYEYALRSAFKRGLFAWIYDEGGWPSGGACGRVLLKHPELAKRALGQKKSFYKKGESFKLSDECLCGFLPSGEMIEEGYVFGEETEVFEYYSKRFFFEWQGLPDYPDLTRKESSLAFIEETFPGYEKHLGDSFSKEICAVFSDEPCTPWPVPFREGIEEEYEKRYGESIRPHLHILWKNTERYFEEFRDEKVPEASALAIIKWYNLCSELFCKNYLQVEKAWANQHNMSFVGHLNGDDLLMGSVRSCSCHLMRALRNFDIPAVDVIWRQIFPGEKQQVEDIITAENRFFPRYASSAASQIGVDLSASESFGVYGQSLTYDEMRYVVGFQAIRGINIFNFMVKNYGRNGFFMTGERPSFGEDLQNVGDLVALNSYVSRLSYIASLGERDVNVALYFPICDVWSGENSKSLSEGFEAAGNQLESDGVYFDIVDDDVIFSCSEEELSSGFISLGKAKYNTVVVSPNKYMPKETVKKLERFIGFGGKVMVVKSSITPYIEGAISVEDCRGVLKPNVSVDFSSGNLRTYSKILENGRMDIIFNQGFAKETLQVDLSGDVPYLIDITFGEIKKLNAGESIAQIPLESGEVVALLYTDEEFSAYDYNNAYNNEIILNDRFKFRRICRYYLGEMEAQCLNYQDDLQDISLGDWRERVGESFYGSCSYCAAFSMPTGDYDSIIIDLGKVNYSAQVFLNGSSLQNLVMPPYKVKVSKDILQENNLLEIRVTNSAANEYKYTKTFDKWSPWQLSPYHKKQMSFCEDKLPGGLFGPVRILY